MAAGTHPDATVQFDVNDGWSWSDRFDARIVAAETFVEALIQPG